MLYLNKQLTMWALNITKWTNIFYFSARSKFVQKVVLLKLYNGSNQTSAAVNWNMYSYLYKLAIKEAHVSYDLGIVLVNNSSNDAIQIRKCVFINTEIQC